MIRPGTFLRSAFLFLFLSLAAWMPGCAAGVGDDADGHEHEDEPGTTEEALRSAVSCVERSVTGYRRGSPYAMKVITVGGKPTAKATAHAFLKLQAAADEAGVTLSIGSGFRSMEEQEYFYGCYKSKECNNGNLAARPGYSNHQNGRALDLATSDWGWLRRNAPKFGFEATVAGERWHWEFMGDDPGGPCSRGSRSAEDASEVGACHSETTGETVAEGACVQSEADEVHYQCHEGQWYRGVSDGSGPYGRCTSTHGL